MLGYGAGGQRWTAAPVLHWPGLGAEEAEDSYQCSGGRGHLPPTTHTTHHSHAMQPSPTLYLLASYLLRLYITCLLLFVMGEKRLVRKYTHLSTTLFMDI